MAYADFAVTEKADILVQAVYNVPKYRFCRVGFQKPKNTPETMYGEMTEILYLFPAENHFFCSRAQRRKVSWAT